MAKKPDARLSKALLIARLAVGIFFIFFGQYKVFGSTFAQTGFAHYLDGYIHQTAVGFYRPVLSHIVLPHAVVFGYLVGVVELFIGISLILGVSVRVASVLGMLHMLSLTLATWWAARTRCAGMEIPRRGTRTSAAVFSLSDFLCRGPHRMVADRKARTGLELPTRIFNQESTLKNQQSYLCEFGLWAGFLRAGARALPILTSKLTGNCCGG